MILLYNIRWISYALYCAQIHADLAVFFHNNVFGTDLFETLPHIQHQLPEISLLIRITAPQDSEQFTVCAECALFIYEIGK